MGHLGNLDKFLKRHDLKGIAQALATEAVILGWTTWLWWSSGLSTVLVMLAITIGASILAAAAVRRRARRQRAAR
jgi:hypothetical protein